MYCGRHHHHEYSFIQPQLPAGIAFSIWICVGVVMPGLKIITTWIPSQPHRSSPASTGEKAPTSMANASPALLGRGIRPWPFASDSVCRIFAQAPQHDVIICCAAAFVSKSIFTPLATSKAPNLKTLKNGLLVDLKSTLFHTTVHYSTVYYMRVCYSTCRWCQAQLGHPSH